MGIAAIILLPYYAKIQDRTDTASYAFGAFLTLCVLRYFWWSGSPGDAGAFCGAASV
jgi:hypothetical protein